MFSNAEILAAVVTKWAMPFASTILGGNLCKIPFLDEVQTKIRSTGWVTPTWRMTDEMIPFAEPVVKAIVTPMLSKSLSNIPDEQIPALAHGMVDKAIKDGQLVLMDGNIKFDNNDLMSLKRLLNANLPFAEPVLTYQVKEDD